MTYEELFGAGVIETETEVTIPWENLPMFTEITTAHVCCALFLKIHSYFQGLIGNGTDWLGGLDYDLIYDLNKTTLRSLGLTCKYVDRIFDQATKYRFILTKYVEL